MQEEKKKESQGLCPYLLFSNAARETVSLWHPCHGQRTFSVASRKHNCAMAYMTSVTVTELCKTMTMILKNTGHAHT